MKTRHILLPLLALSATGALLAAAPGDLDTTFNGTGKVTTPVGMGNALARSLAVQSDGKIVAVGHAFNGQDDDFAAVRYNANGTLDASFGIGGKVTTSVGSGADLAQAVVVQADGKIVVAGYSEIGSTWAFAIVRYNPDGCLDPSFNGSGKVLTRFGSDRDFALCVAVQSDGKILVGGNTNYIVAFSGDIALARYNTDGSLDATFNGTGKVTTPASNTDAEGRSVVVLSDGKILVAGRGTGAGLSGDIVLVRYQSDGSLDPTFNGTGVATADVYGQQDQSFSLAVQSDGKIVVAGQSGLEGFTRIAVVRFESGGGLDASFNGTGTLTTAVGSGYDSALGVAIQSDGKIVVGGYSQRSIDYDFAVVRYYPNGSLDTSFGPNSDGKVTTAIDEGEDIGHSMVLQSNGDIIVAGWSFNGMHYDFAVARYDGFTKAPVLAIEQPAGVPTPNGGTKNIVAGVGIPGTMTFTINNMGTSDLSGLAATIDGAAAFSVTSHPNAPVSPGGTTSLAVQFLPTVSSPGTADLHIASNDATRNPFTIHLTGQVLLASADTDGDGMSDAAEFALSPQGFDWQSAQPAKVAAFLTNTALYDQTPYSISRIAGQNDVINSPNAYGLYTLSQVQTLNIGTPLLTKDPGTGKFKLTIGLQRSTGLQTWESFPFTSPDTTINALGNVEFLFAVPGNAAFFRLQSH